MLSAVKNNLGKGEAESSSLSGSTTKFPIYHRVIGDMGITISDPSCAEQRKNMHRVVTTGWQSMAGGVHGAFAVDRGQIDASEMA